MIPPSGADRHVRSRSQFKSQGSRRPYRTNLSPRPHIGNTNRRPTRRRNSAAAASKSRIGPLHRPATRSNQRRPQQPHRRSNRNHSKNPGEAFFSDTTWENERCIRVSVVSWQTSDHDVQTNAKHRAPSAGRLEVRRPWCTHRTLHMARTPGMNTPRGYQIWAARINGASAL